MQWCSFQFKLLRSNWQCLSLEMITALKSFDPLHTWRFDTLRVRGNAHALQYWQEILKDWYLYLSLRLNRSMFHWRRIYRVAMSIIVRQLLTWTAWASSNPRPGDIHVRNHCYCYILIFFNVVMNITCQIFVPRDLTGRPTTSGYPALPYRWWW